MINFIISENFYSLFAGIGLMAAFLMTCVCITKFNYLLPKDAGRDFAHDGKLSAGKPRGAGIIFILVFAAAALLFSELSVEIVIYIAIWMTPQKRRGMSIRKGYSIFWLL